MIINPILPIWLMAVLCVGLLFLKRKGWAAFIRQLLIVILLFAINLRLMIPNEQMKVEEQDRSLYVLFVVDDTISMVARDMKGEEGRLSAVKRDCEYIVDELQGAKFSVISFNNNVSVLSPYTSNSDHIKNTINAIYPLEEMYARGTTLNKPKEIMLSLLKDTYAKEDGKVILFFISDGEITDDSKLESYAELKEYVDGGAVLGYGRTQGGKMFVRNFFDDEEELVTVPGVYPPEPAISKLDEKNLKQLADDMGITYLQMLETSKVDATLEKIKKLEQSMPKSVEKKTVTKSVTGATDLYYLFVIPLMLLMIWEAIVWIVKKEEA